MTAFWECIWKTSAATVLVWMVTLLLRRRSAALRHSLWLCALGAFILIPALLPLAHRTPPVRLAISIPAAFDTLPLGGRPFTRAITRASAGKPKYFPLNESCYACG